MGKEAEQRKSALPFARAYDFLLADSNLTAAEKLVMTIVCRYWPNPYWDTNIRIAKELSFTERYIEKIVKRLAGKKYIKRGFAHTTKNGRPHTVRVIVPLCFPGKCNTKVKWIKTEHMDGQYTEQADAQNPNNRTQSPEHMDDLLERNKKEINTQPEPSPVNGQAQASLEQIKKTFGFGKWRASNLTPEQKEQRKQQQIKALRASEKK